ncbi:MAG: T9SS type A sorting domain-containing protein [Bacteroidales bacterium]|nr:T9SS type A sorting domain-containing protein [Bacteroidales bacterium]
MKKYGLYTLLALLLMSGAKAFGQVWEFADEFSYSSDECMTSFDATELSDGTIAVSSVHYFKSGEGDFYSYHSAARKLSADGELLAEKSHFRESYFSPNIPYLIENPNGGLYMLATYSPDHDHTYFNYFKNYDDPPDKAIIGLYKLDENLEIEASYEHDFVIDTFEKHDSQWNYLPNHYSGEIYVFSAFEDAGSIVGGYIKTISHGNENQDWHDSIFFFRMNFEGEFEDFTGYEMTTRGGAVSFVYRRNHIVKDDSGYLFYIQGNGCLVEFSPNVNRKGCVFRLDEHLNVLNVREFRHADYSQMPENTFYNITVKRSDHNTTYLATSSKSKSDPSNDEDCRLYEYDDSGTSVSVTNHIIRGTDQWDMPAMLKGVDLANDNTVYFAYTLNVGFMNDLDSWMMIERLDTNLDTISTVYYDLGGYENIHSEAFGITATNDGGVLLVFSSVNLNNTDQHWTTVTKFPAEAFVGIEEAHNCGLKMAIAYPNPGKDVLNIRTGLRDAWVEVYDVKGRLVHRQDITENVTVINTTDWSNGTYVWKVYAGVSMLRQGSATSGSTTPVETGKWIKE